MRIAAVDRFFGVLSYLPVVPWLLLWPFKARRQSMFAQFNIRQGAVLSLLFLLACLIAFAVIVFASDVVGFLIFFVILFVYVVMALLGMFKVLLGERYRMPVVADVALALKL